MAAKQLTRSFNNSYIAGICGGLASYFEVDPVLVRIAAVAGLILSGGTFLIIYLAAWIIIPSERKIIFSAAGKPGGEPPTPASTIRRTQFWSSYFPGLLLIGIGVIFLLRHVWWLSWEYLWPAVLIVIGLMVIIFSMNSGRASDPQQLGEGNDR